MKGQDVREMRFIVAVDFDGVIHKYSQGYHDGSIYDGPMEGAKETMAFLKSLGVVTIIHSARSCAKEIVNGKGETHTSPGQLEDMLAWLHEHEIEYSSVWVGLGKPIAHVYLDDRALLFSTWGAAKTVIGSLMDAWRAHK